MPKPRRSRRRKNSLLGLWIGLGILGGVVFVGLILLLVKAGSHYPPQSPPGPRVEFRAVLSNIQFVPSRLNAFEVDVIPQQGQPDPELRYVFHLQRNGPGGATADEQTVPHDLLIRGGRHRVETSVPFRSNSTYHLGLMVYTTSKGRREVSNSLFFQGPSNN